MTSFSDAGQNLTTPTGLSAGVGSKSGEKKGEGRKKERERKKKEGEEVETSSVINTAPAVALNEWCITIHKQSMSSFCSLGGFYFCLFMSHTASIWGTTLFGHIKTMS